MKPPPCKKRTALPGALPIALSYQDSLNSAPSSVAIEMSVRSTPGMGCREAAIAAIPAVRFLRRLLTSPTGGPDAPIGPDLLNLARSSGSIRRAIGDA